MSGRKRYVCVVVVSRKMKVKVKVKVKVKRTKAEESSTSSPTRRGLWLHQCQSNKVLRPRLPVTRFPRSKTWLKLKLHFEY